VILPVFWARKGKRTDFWQKLSMWPQRNAVQPWLAPLMACSASTQAATLHVIPLGILLTISGSNSRISRLETSADASERGPSGRGRRSGKLSIARPLRYSSPAPAPRPSHQHSLLVSAPKARLSSENRAPEHAFLCTAGGAQKVDRPAASDPAA
jgi:hypothetical protein